MPSVVVFDIGGVLVDWQPHLAWEDEFGCRSEAEAFMDRVSFRERNARADAGERFADLAAELDDPDDRRRLSDYVAHYPKTVRDQVPGTWEIVDRLIARGVPLHAITNWSAETWPRGLTVHPRLGDIFGTLVVSGRERVAKPDIAIFELLCERAGVAASDCVFIDDTRHNVDAARTAGMDGIHFTGARALNDALVERGRL